MAIVGAPPGTETACAGCGVTFIRRKSGQKYHNNRCKVVHGSWAYPTLWGRRGPKGSPREWHAGPESK